MKSKSQISILYILMGIVSIGILGGSIYYFATVEEEEELIPVYLNDTIIDDIEVIQEIASVNTSNMTNTELQELVQNITDKITNVTNKTNNSGFVIKYISSSHKRKVTPPSGGIY